MVSDIYENIMMGSRWCNWVSSSTAHDIFKVGRIFLVLLKLSQQAYAQIHLNVKDVVDGSICNLVKILVYISRAEWGQTSKT